MKNSIFLMLGFFIFTSSQLLAQIKIGVSAGPTLSYIARQNDKPDLGKIENYKPLVGMHVGAFMAHKPHEKINTELELRYSKQGASPYKGQKYHQHYIYAPITVKYFPISHLSIDFGTDLGILLKNNVVYFKDESIIDLGLHLGTSYHITEDLAIGFRYMHGFAKFDKYTITDSNGNDLATISHQNRLFELNVKYALFSFEKKG